MPYELLEAEYLLFENQNVQDMDDSIIKVTDIDKILFSIIDIHKHSKNFKSLKIDQKYILVIQKVLNMGRISSSIDND